MRWLLDLRRAPGGAGGGRRRPQPRVLRVAIIGLGARHGAWWRSRTDARRAIGGPGSRSAWEDAVAGPGDTSERPVASSWCTRPAPGGSRRARAGSQSHGTSVHMTRCARFPSTAPAAVLICNPWSGGGKSRSSTWRSWPQASVSRSSCSTGARPRATARDAVARGPTAWECGGDGSQALSPPSPSTTTSRSSASAGTRNHSPSISGSTAMTRG